MAAENHGTSDSRDFASELDSSLGHSIMTHSSSFRAEMKTGAMMTTTTKNKCLKQSSLDEDDFINLLHGSDPVKIELNRLENDVRDKDRELIEAHNEIKALRLTERAKEKALAMVTEELEKMVEKFQASEAALENKEWLKIYSTKSQFAAEATLRRVHAAQKDEELPPLEAILAPLEAEIKLVRQELAKLQDDKRALERLTKSKEAALLDAEKEVQLAKVKASLVDDLQNKNQELMKQIEISQEEYKILDKMHRHKVIEVEKLGQTVHQLEEALLSGAAAANAVRDYQRQVNELMGEKKTLERTLSRAKATENRVAVVVANEWKDANDKLMPVKQWLEERRILMGEMQQLRDKLSKAERTAKTEAQLKEKFQLRLKVVEDILKSLHSGSRSSELRSNSNGIPQRLGGSEISLRLLSSGIAVRKSPASLIKIASNHLEMFMIVNIIGMRVMGYPRVALQLIRKRKKEVISLRKACQEKDESLKEKDTAIEMLSKKVDTLTKAMEVEAKKVRREKAAMEKEVASLRVEKEHEQKPKYFNSSKGLANNLHLPSGRNSRTT
ncbi:hypothetical protein MRB53_027817 [Persea americana]|uniref:Uncharacterized protein n=1 Tax=Persea americana TaxID=3435 RepID=A0ACC2KEE9_PERAE|nr:hypothetical protein MRB53_027817 [Persea americana]